MGAAMVKLFPAGLYGPGYIRALRGPFDKIKIMAVGGVNENNIAEYFRQGANAVAFGAGIVRPEWLDKSRYDLVEECIMALIQAYKGSISV
jgi:2-dehydro-3-deoxyphosphogluconate aldolase / (4S)-4-hydroxy-2-oxoglutarate aldolase